MTQRKAALSLTIGLLVLTVWPASAQSPITVSAPGGFSRQQLAFVHSGAFGLVISGNPPNGEQLLSFSTETGQVVDSVDLSPDFAGVSQTGEAAAGGGHSASGADPVATAPGTVFSGAYRQTKAGTITYYSTEVFPITIHTFDSSGLVAVCGPAGVQKPGQAALTQRVLMFLVDMQGKLSLQWSQSFGGPVSAVFSIPGVAFGSDGSRLYVQYLTEDSIGSFGESLALVDCSDGTTLDSIQLPGRQGDPGLVL
ncbi:MAG: hypothetical protein ACREDR_42830, partial [Blastocatellia bacterium]